MDGWPVTIPTISQGVSRYDRRIAAVPPRPIALHHEASTNGIKHLQLKNGGPSFKSEAATEHRYCLKQPKSDELCKVCFTCYRHKRVKAVTHPIKGGSYRLRHRLNLFMLVTHPVKGSSSPLSPKFSVFIKVLYTSGICDVLYNSRLLQPPI